MCTFDGCLEKQKVEFCCIEVGTEEAKVYGLVLKGRISRREHGLFTHWWWNKIFENVS